MKKIATVMTFAAIISGCAAGGGNYVNPLTNIRNLSMTRVERYAKTVKAFLATGTQDQVIEAAKVNVANSLKDPGSAQFKNVHLVNYLDGSVVCGEINAKNSYGGYVGFSPFVASNIDSDMYDKDSKYPEIQAAANAGLTEACIKVPATYRSIANQTLSIAEPGKFQWPAAGSQVFGYDGIKNKGLDIAGSAGDRIYAAAGGKVVYSGSGLRGFGKLIIIKHDSTYLTAYAHNQALLVTEGQEVAKGQEIAEMGDSESDRVKLHFEIRRNGQSVDPAPFLPGR